jgi:methylenetetrahydrofolate reductase (NADPH)
VRDELSKGTPTFSFEFGPPRTPEAERTLWQAIRELEPLNPSFVSVTYGAGGSTRDRTIELTEHIASDTQMLPVAHLTAVNHSVDDLRNIIGRVAEAGISDVLALRGDPPGDPQAEWVEREDGLRYAAELVEMVKGLGDFCVGVAAFPHRHPRSVDAETDTALFVQKCRAGADYAITQMFFEADDYLRLRDRVTAAGGDVPIIAGVMPVTNLATIARSEALSGAPFPPKLAAKFQALVDDPAAVRALGIEQASQLSRTLLDEGVPGIHFITFNRSKAIREVWDNIHGSPAAPASSLASPSSPGVNPVD